MQSEVWLPSRSPDRKVAESDCSDSYCCLLNELINTCEKIGADRNQLVTFLNLIIKQIIYLKHAKSFEVNT